MARGFFDDDSLAMLSGQELTGEKFDPLEKSMEFINRVKTVQTEIELLQADVKDIWNEARDYGLDIDVLKTVLRRMRKSKPVLEDMDNAVAEIEFRMDGRNLDGETYEREDDDAFDIS